MTKSKSIRTLLRVAAVTGGLLGGTFTYWLYLAASPSNLLSYILFMLLGLVPLLVLCGLQRGGWRNWARVFAVLFIWIVTDLGALWLMICVSQVWLYWRVIVADGRDWVFGSKGETN